MMAIRLLMVAGLLSVLVSQTIWALDEEIARHPNQAIVEDYRANEKTVEDLRSKISSSSNLEDRVSAFSALAKEYPLAAEITARSYVTDDNEEIALAAIQVLKGATVMGDHAMPRDSVVLPQVAYMMERHQRSRAALRAAIIDNRYRVRQEAASFLASLSDEVALDVIANDDNGLYSDLQAANLFTLARAEAVQSYLQRYVGNGDVDAQRTAISYLSAIPACRQDIRDAYLLNSDAPSLLRTDAARALSRYDAEFPAYALNVARDRRLDPTLLEAIVGLVRVQVEQRRFDPTIAGALSNQIRMLLDSSPTYIPRGTLLAMKDLSQRLDAISGVTRRN